MTRNGATAFRPQVAIRLELGTGAAIVAAKPGRKKVHLKGTATGVNALPQKVLSCLTGGAKQALLRVALGCSCGACKGPEALLRGRCELHMLYELPNN
jgi:hypothetical protein